VPSERSRWPSDEEFHDLSRSRPYTCKSIVRINSCVKSCKSSETIKVANVTK
jgi:hypothetical protein